jgi:hypothetical protein
MAYALAYPEGGGKGGRGRKGNPAESAGFGERTLRDARAILRWSAERWRVRKENCSESERFPSLSPTVFFCASISRRTPRLPQPSLGCSIPSNLPALPAPDGLWTGLGRLRTAFPGLPGTPPYPKPTGGVCVASLKPGSSDSGHSNPCFPSSKPSRPAKTGGFTASLLVSPSTTPQFGCNAEGKEGFALILPAPSVTPLPSYCHDRPSPPSLRAALRQLIARWRLRPQARNA